MVDLLYSNLCCKMVHLVLEVEDSRVLVHAFGQNIVLRYHIDTNNKHVSFRLSRCFFFFCLGLLWSFMRCCQDKQT